jgi:hypothetical protein
MDQKWIKRLYIIFVGIILAMTTGFGVAAFYPERMQPTYPMVRTTPESCYRTPDSQSSPECKKIADEDHQRQVEYQEKLVEYRNSNAGYTRTAVFLGVSIGAILVVLGIVLIKISSLVANGLMLGGVLTAVLTRFLVMLASLGSSVSTTAGPNQLAYIEFAVLVVLSMVITLVGLTTLKD